MDRDELVNQFYAIQQGSLALDRFTAAYPTLSRQNHGLVGEIYRVEGYTLVGAFTRVRIQTRLDSSG